MLTVFRRTSALASVLVAASLLCGAPSGAQVAAGSAISRGPGVAGTSPSSEGVRIREAGPLDGQLCCEGVEPLVFHGDEALASTGRAGIFKSSDRGASWTRSMTGLVAPNGVSPIVNAICQAPSDPRVVYVLAGEGSAISPFNGLFRSNDFGKTWTRRASADTGFGVNLCAVDALDPRTVYVSGFESTTFADAVWRSTDGGLTLQVFGADVAACSLGGVFSRREVLYFTGSVCSVLSTDDGSTLQPFPIAPERVALDISPDGNSIFVESDSGVFRSTDRGMSYLPVGGLPNGFDTYDLAFDPTNPARIFATDGDLRVSSDAGATFALVPARYDLRFSGPIDDISVDSHGSVFVNTPVGLFRSDDAGSRFHSLKEGFRASSLNDLAFDADGKLLVPVYHTQAIFRQTHGTDFEAIGGSIGDAGINGTAVAASPVDSKVILLGTDFAGLFRTGNGGRTWTPATFSDDAASFARARMSFATASRVYLAASTGFYRSDDAGQTFTRLSDLHLGSLAVDPRNADVLYVGTYSSGEGLFKSTDGGRTFQDLGQPGAFSSLVVDHQDPSIVYAGQQSGQVIRSLDGGRSFASASKGLRGAGVHGIAQDAKGTLFAWLRGGGLFSSGDRGVRWRAVDAGEALQRSGAEAGRAVLVADPRRAGHVYLGNAGVLEVIASDEST